MAQAAVENVRYSAQLSKVTFVQVTHMGEVNFVIKPEQSYLPDTVVNFNQANWINLMTVAKPAIDEAIRGKTALNLNYHASCKVVKVYHRENKKYQVHFLTFTMKGAMKPKHSVFMTQEEYQKFEEYLDDINYAVDNTSPQTQKTVLTGYRWRLVPKDENNANQLPSCPLPFYLEQQAGAAGAEAFFKENQNNSVLRSETYKEFLPIPDEMTFLKKVYLYSMYQGCLVLSTLIEERDLPSDEVVKHYLPLVREIVGEDLISQLYLKAWKELELPLSNVDALMKDLRNVYELHSTNELLKVALCRMSPVEEDSDLRYIAWVVRCFPFPEGCTFHEHIEGEIKDRTLKKMGRFDKNKSWYSDEDEEWEDVRQFCMREKLSSAQAESLKRKLPISERVKNSKHLKRFTTSASDGEETDEERDGQHSQKLLTPTSTRNEDRIVESYDEPDSLAGK